jgi:hypothetical protein
MSIQVELYKAARERLRAARLRGEEAEAQESTVAAIWSMLSEADRRAVLGAGESVPEELKRAA